MTDVEIPFDPIAYHGDHGWNPPAELPRPAWVVDSEGRVLLRCACGLLIGSPTNHSIAEDGTVRASLLHTPDAREDDRLGGQTCTWHVFGRLVGWEDGAIGAGIPKLAPRARARVRT